MDSKVTSEENSNTTVYEQFGFPRSFFISVDCVYARTSSGDTWKFTSLDLLATKGRARHVLR